MEEIFGTFGTVITEWFFAFVGSKTFFVIKIILAIYSAILIVDVILIVYLDNPRTQLRKMRRGAATSKTAKRGDQKIWDAIMARLASDNADQFKAAVLEADQFTAKALELQGYSGSNFSERLAQIPPGSFTSTAAVRDAHALSNKIVHDERITVTQEQARNTLGVYEKFLKNLDYL
jgi:hypothetical protein